MSTAFYGIAPEYFDFQSEIESNLEGEVQRRRRRPSLARRPPPSRPSPRRSPPVAKGNTRSLSGSTRPSPTRRPPPSRPSPHQSPPLPGEKTRSVSDFGLLNDKKKPYGPSVRPGLAFWSPPLVIVPERPQQQPKDGQQRPTKEPDRTEPPPGADTSGYVPSLTEGSEYIRWVQSTLNAILGLELPLNGRLDPPTRAALIDFQHLAGLPANGILGPETEQMLVSYRKRMILPSQEIERFGEAFQARFPLAELDSAAGQINLRQPSRTKAAATQLPPGFEKRRNWTMYPENAYEINYLAGETETGIELAGLAVGAASLGVGTFQVVQQLATSGDLSVQADIARYVHQNTPANIPFTKASVEFGISAHHPLRGFDRQNFYFRLTFEYNRYDLRNVSITPLRDKSSSMFSSTFNIQFKASPYSQPSNPVAEILYTVLGRWDPAGPGDVSFDGEIKVRADGYVQGAVTSELNWVRWDGFLSATRRDTLIALPPVPGLAPSASTNGVRPTLRTGSRGQSVIDLQLRLNRWLASHGRQQLKVDGIFGNQTRAAVIAFQQAVRLAPDGTVGPKTWDTLVKHY